MDANERSCGHFERGRTATPSFTPTVKGSYKFSLTVNDGAIDSKADKVTVQVKKAP